MGGASEIERKLSVISKRDAISILYELRHEAKRFSDLPGNTDTRTKRLKELSDAKLVEPTLVKEKRSRPKIAYKITEKGLSVLEDVEELERKL